MKDKEKVRIIILVVITIILMGVLVLRNKRQEVKSNNDGNSYSERQSEKKIEEKYVQILEDGTKKNISEKIGKTHRREEK